MLQLLVFSILLIAYQCFLFFFFLMIRRPPRSTLFPTRRSSDLAEQLKTIFREAGFISERARSMTVASESAKSGRFQRSEEHTSELQSRLHLVCRLLLEKKKK